MKILLFTCLIAGGAWFVKSRFFHPSHGEIEGRWSIETWPEGWKAVPGSHVNITGRDVKIIVGVIPVRTMTYEFDPAEGTIDTKRQEGANTVTQLGRYHREGDTLTLSIGNDGKPRPESIDSTENGSMKWVLHLAK